MDSHKKEVLVTGGCGFIGSKVVKELLSQDYSVAVIDKNVHDEQKGAKYYTLNICDDSLLEKMVDVKPDIILHLAAQAHLRVSLDDPIGDARTNIIGTINMLEFAKAVDCKTFIYTSTGGARYGNVENLPASEKTPLNPLSPYGISKHSAEHYVWLYGEMTQMDTTSFCFGNVYGPGDTVTSGRLVPVLCQKVLDNKPLSIFGDGLQTRDYLYVDDLSQFLVSTMVKNRPSSLYNLAAGEETSVLDLVKEFEAGTNQTVELDYVSAIPGEVNKLYLDISLATKELGWVARTSLQDGLRKTWESLRKE